jgi:hypothetical protein
MAKAKILTGARAKVLINGKTVGLFSNCTWSLNQEKVANFVLGRFSPAEITPTSQEAVSITLRGYRVVDSGPYKVANATMLKDLLTEEDFSVVILDRQPPGKSIFTAVGCRVLGWSSGVAAKGVSDIELRILGLRAEDEHGTAQGGDSEDPDAAKIDDGSI